VYQREHVLHTSMVLKDVPSNANNFGISIETYLSMAVLELKIFEASSRIVLPSPWHQEKHREMASRRSRFQYFQFFLRQGANSALLPSVVTFSIPNTKQEKTGESVPFALSADTIFFIYWNDRRRNNVVYFVKMSLARKD